MNTNFISTSETLRLIGTFTFILAILTVLTSVLAYLPTHSEFSIVVIESRNYAVAVGMPQILFNTGTILAAPLRYIIIVLLVLRFRDMGQISKSFEIAVLVIGAFSTIGTILMTAVPFSIAPAVHKSGIGLYFLGVVFLQSIIGIKELSIKQLPWSLPVWSFAVVASFLIFFVLVMLHEMGHISRNTPVFWEWMCFFTSTGWLAWHTMVLGK